MLGRPCWVLLVVLRCVQTLMRPGTVELLVRRSAKQDFGQAIGGRRLASALCRYCSYCCGLLWANAMLAHIDDTTSIPGQESG